MIPAFKPTNCFKEEVVKKMKFNPTMKKAGSALLILLLMAGLYGAIIALCNQYPREHDMLTNTSKFMLGTFMFAGFYFIYKWFAKRIDSIQEQNTVSKRNTKLKERLNK